jgi:aminopeptidase N
VKRLKAHPAFTISNPNRARSLIGSFAENVLHFHARDGVGYRFLADCVLEIDPINPQVAARMVASFSQWKRFDQVRGQLMKSQLERILAEGVDLSRDTYEVVNRCLK